MLKSCSISSAATHLLITPCKESATTMGRLKQYVDMVAKSQVLAPNLKELTLRLYTGRLHTGNDVAR